MICLVSSLFGVVGFFDKQDVKMWEDWNKFKAQNKGKPNAI